MFGRRTRGDADFAEEIEAHIRLEADRLIEDGVSPREAMAAARRAFGNVARAQERFYESTRWMWFDHLRRDAGHALNQMRRTPVMTTTIIASLALGVGFNTAMFSLVEKTLIRPLPIPRPEQLVQLDWQGRWIGGEVGLDQHLFPYTFYQALREQTDVFAGVLARTSATTRVSLGDHTEPITIGVVSSSYFSTLGVTPALGRVFGDHDDSQPTGPPIVVLSHAFWRRRFAADPDVVGRQLRINDQPMTVVGVAQSGFRGMDWSSPPALWVPMAMLGQLMPGENLLNNRRVRFAHVYGRLPDGVDAEGARARLGPWFESYLRTDAEAWTDVSDPDRRQYLASDLDVLPRGRGYSRAENEVRQPVLLLLAAAGLILLLACLNVANLLLARNISRRKVTALQTALGASRRRIMTERLVESTLLAAAGCLVGIVLAPSLSRGVLAYFPAPESAMSGLTATLDLRLLAFASMIGGLTTLVSGTAPALHTALVPPATVLQPDSTGAPAGLTLRKAIVVGQVALALILLIGAGLFARTLHILRHQGPGYSTANLLSFHLDPGGAEHQSPQQRKEGLRTILAEVQRLPGVTDAGLSAVPMLSGQEWNNPVVVQSTERRTIAGAIPVNAVSPRLFATLGLPIVSGRDFHDGDYRAEAGWGLRSAIVNQEFVDRYIPSGNALGARLALTNQTNVVPTIEIVGVVPSFHDRGLREPEAHVFVPVWERNAGSGTFYVRVNGASPLVTQSIQTAVARHDPAMTVSAFRNMDDAVDRFLTSERMLSTASGVFAGVATLLAMIGLYAVLAFAASLRRKEIGIRLALGAGRWSAGGLIVREAAILLTIGLILALPIAWALTRAIEHQLFGVRPMDPATLATAVLVFALISITAIALPVRNAWTVDALEILKSD